MWRQGNQQGFLLARMFTLELIKYTHLTGRSEDSNNKIEDLDGGIQGCCFRCTKTRFQWGVFDVCSMYGKKLILACTRFWKTESYLSGFRKQLDFNSHHSSSCQLHEIRDRCCSFRSDDYQEPFHSSPCREKNCVKNKACLVKSSKRSLAEE